MAPKGKAKKPRARKVPAGHVESGLDASLWGMVFDTPEDMLAEMQRQSGRRWKMGGESAAAATPLDMSLYTLPLRAGSVSAVSMWARKVVSMSPPSEPVRRETQVFCLPQSLGVDCFTLPIGDALAEKLSVADSIEAVCDTEGNDSTIKIKGRRETLGLSFGYSDNAAMQSYVIGTRVYVTTWTPMDADTKGRVIAFHDLDTPMHNWEVVSWDASGPGYLSLSWAMGECIYFIGYAQQDNTDTLRETLFHIFDTESLEWKQGDVPPFMASQVTNTVMAGFSDTASFDPCQSRVCVVNHTAYVFCSSPKGEKIGEGRFPKQVGSLGGVCTYSPRTGWRDMTKEVCQAMRNCPTPYLFKHSCGVGTSHVVCGQFIVFLGRDYTTYPVYDTVSGRWTEWETLPGTFERPCPIDHAILTEDGRMVFSSFSSFGVADVDQGLVYPSGDMKWASSN
ncbi:hypothetical protein KIPB_000335 [Kipferlia bialata]|uniref:Uncharacterized protein n=1 Tax=Kipferlia bialata TaxID=797122 RepID=A0A391NNJ1_9EUKA|nr:hypothetical protein KIPB_000335 [Kipferlia bialata]|eukprot:g335.t1